MASDGRYQLAGIILNAGRLWRYVRIRLSRHVHFFGLLVGTLFFAVSLAPSLLPRADLIQGLLSGVSLSIGYALGMLIYLGWQYLHLPLPPMRWRHLLHWLASLVCLAVVLLFLWRASAWQNSVRELMGMEAVGGLQMSVIAATTLLIFLLFLLVFRLFRRTFAVLSGFLQKFVPARVSLIVGMVAALFLFWSILEGVLLASALRIADRSYQQIDALIEPEFAAPLDAQATGSAASLVSWEQLGRQGRRFVSQTPTLAQIRQFSPQAEQSPLRIYVGLNSAETPQQRAELALAELLRVDAFSRRVLVLITPTGTGWVDPASIETLEFLQHGDIASVAAQYSYLSSPLAILSEADYGVETARAMFQTIYGYWSALPADNRPALYLLGLSLGALNSDLSFDFYDIIEDPFQGALWSGPPFRSETWRTVTQLRDAGSPYWRPVFRQGSVVRFANQDGGLTLPAANWGGFRLAFLQYASDPIVFFSPQILYQEPEWLRGQRGHDVTPYLRWYPVVTLLQLAADMASGVVPRGYGHNYAADHYLDSWLALTEPPGWSEAELTRLRVYFADRY